jgi:hypothetical protein
MVKPSLHDLAREILVALMSPRWGWSWHHHAWGWRIAVVTKGLRVSGPGDGPIVVPFNDLHDAVLMLARTMLSNDRSYQLWALSALAARRP